jgi:hypothetical protein
MGPILASVLAWILFAIALGLALIGSYFLASAPYSDEKKRRPYYIMAICCYFLALLTGAGFGICMAIGQLNGG